MRRALAVALVVLGVAHARAAEIDSVTERGAELRDSASQMESRINDFVRDGVRRANERGKGCDRGDLYKQIRRAISFPFIGHALAERLNAAEDLDRRRIQLRDSIYRDLGIFDAISVHLRDLSAVIRVRDHLVGVDKFGHFFVQGWKYFEVAYLEEKGIERALAWGERSERTYFGLYTTGIYSYADLAVNFEGMRFWLRVLGEEKDPLEKGYFFNRPYVKCSKRFWTREPYWRVKRKVRLGDYLSAAWDEGANCSQYRDTQIEGLILARVAEREAIDAAEYSCPIRPGDCARARDRYGIHAERLLHPFCLFAEPEPRPWWKFW